MLGLLEYIKQSKEETEAFGLTISLRLKGSGGR